MARRVELLAQALPAPCDARACASAASPELLHLDGDPAQVDAFSVAEFVRATRRVLQRAAQAAASCGDGLGVPELREWVCAHLERQGLRLRPSQVLITGGSRQALDLLARVLLDASSPLLVQRPTHAGALHAFTPYAPRIVGLSGDERGPLPSSLEAALPGARLLYLQPAAADPDAADIDGERARELVELLRGARCWLVEHDVQGEVGRDAPPGPGLLARGAPYGVHVGDFCGMGLPDLRLGWIAGHAPLLGELVRARVAAGSQPSALSQRVLLELLRSGAVERALPAWRSACGQRRGAMLDALHRHMPAGVRWNHPRAGLFVWVTLPQGVDGERVAELAARRGVAVAAGGAFDAGAGGCDTFGSCWQCRFAEDAEAAAPMRNTLRLTCAQLEPRELELAVARLGGAVREALGAGGEPPSHHGLRQGDRGALAAGESPGRGRLVAMIRA